MSAVCDLGLEVYARQTIHEQEEEIFEPRMRAMMRQEIRSSDKRHINFEMRNAMASEQTRLMITDLYTRQLRKEGLPLPEIQEKLKSMYHKARSNVLKKTPQHTSMLDAWWQEEATGEEAAP